MSPRRLAEDLNQALRVLADLDQHLYLLGEDVGDPYGGAFKVTKGLSTRYPDRVLSTPISEAAVVGAATGLALHGNRVIVEIMFGDFIGLCFDQLVNIASKSVGMYGRTVELAMVVRSPVGGHRGYGPTHSQNLSKHLLGVPHLSLYELSPFHDVQGVFQTMLGRGEPCVFLEDKGLYPRSRYLNGTVDDVFRYASVDPAGNWVRVFADTGAVPDCLLIAPGGMAPRAIDAMRAALLRQDILAELLVPSRLYPLDLAPVLPLVRAAGRVCVAEDGIAGANWAREVAGQLYEQTWGQLSAAVRLVHPGCGIIPAARHLEDEFVVTSGTIHSALVEMVLPGSPAGTGAAR